MKTGIVINYSEKHSTINFKKMSKILRSDFSYNLCFVVKSEEVFVELNNFQKQNPKNVHVIALDTWKSNSWATHKGIHYFYSQRDISYIGLLGEDQLLNITEFNLLKSYIQNNNTISIALHRRSVNPVHISSNKLLTKLKAELSLRILKFRTGVSLKGASTGERLFTRSIVPIIFEEDSDTFKSNDLEIFVRLKYYLGKKNIQQHYCILYN